MDGQTRFFADTDTVPIDGVLPRAWRDAVVDDRGRVERIPYELCVLVALRDALRRREIYARGAHRWRDPDEDLPGDFDTTREVHYAAIRQPTDPTAFITGLRERMTTALAGLDAALVNGTAGGVKITTRRGEPWISIPKPTALPEPRTLAAVKDEVIRRCHEFFRGTSASNPRTRSANVARGSGRVNNEPATRSVSRRRSASQPTS